MRITPYILIHMTSAHLYNQDIAHSLSAWAWMAVLGSLGDSIPSCMGPLLSPSLTVLDATMYVKMRMGRSRPSGSLWKYYDSESGPDGTQNADRAYEGCSVTCRDILVITGDSLLTSGIINAALIELREVVRSQRTYVLLVEQASSFHSYGSVLVPEEAALRAAKEVANVVGACERVAMVMNVGGVLWIAAVVDVRTKRINVMGSLSSISDGRAKAVERIMLFTTSMDEVSGTGRKPWTVVNDSACEQSDGYNCGPIAVAQTVCAVTGLDVDPCASGDVIRLAIVYSILNLGEAHERARETVSAR